MGKKRSGPSLGRRQRLLVVAGAVFTAWLPIYFGPLGEWMKEHPPQFMAWMESHVTLAVVLFMAATALAVIWAIVIPQPVDSQPLDEAVGVLADAVTKQWRAEEVTLRLQAPRRPLLVQWGNTERPVADRWEAIHTAPDRDEPVDLSGQLGGQRDDDIAAVFGRVASRRLVILGAPGAGKTVLALNLVLKLLEQRQDGDRVPVLFSMGSWDPASELLHAWMARRLCEDHPRLQSRSGSGSTLAQDLIKTGRVLPVLDGLDELSPPARAKALAELSRQLMRGEPLVVTCRAEEYEEATREHVLTGAAVIELRPLDQADLRKYLRAATHPARANKWAPVFAELEDHSDGPVAQALATPLMAWLARTAYADTDAAPAKLVFDEEGNRRFADRTAVEDHLLDRLIPTVYSRDLSEEGSRGWTSTDAHHWLSFLAQHLHDLDTSDLGWWQLGTTMRRSSRMVVVGLVTGLACGLIVWLVDGLTGITGGLGLTRGLVTGLVNGLLNGAVVGLFFGLAHGIAPKLMRAPLKPSRVHIRIRGRDRPTRPKIVPRLMLGLGVGLAVGVMVGLLFGLFNALVTGRGVMLINGLGNAAIFGLILGVGGGLVLGFTAWLESPIDPEDATDPAALLHVNRGTVLFQGLVGGLVFGLMVWCESWLLIEPLDGYLWNMPLVWTGPMALRLAFLSGLGGGLGTALSLTAWGQWLALARIWLPLTGRAPWAVNSFLKDAHQRGILRQNGAYYQFRHARLQDHLSPAHD